METFKKPGITPTIYILVVLKVIIILVFWLVWSGIFLVTIPLLQQLIIIWKSQLIDKLQHLQHLALKPQIQIIQQVFFQLSTLMEILQLKQFILLKYLFVFLHRQLAQLVILVVCQYELLKICGYHYWCQW